MMTATERPLGSKQHRILLVESLTVRDTLQPILAAISHGDARANLSTISAAHDEERISTSADSWLPLTWPAAPPHAAYGKSACLPTLRFALQQLEYATISDAAQHRPNPLLVE